MSTPATPATVLIQSPAPAPTNPVSAFLKHHETLIIIVLGFLLFWLVSGRIENIIAAHDNNNLNTVKAELAAQVDADKKTADLVAQQAADMKALNAKVLAQDAALAQANRALATALTQRQQTNNNLPLPELAARWSVLVPGASGITFDGTHLLVDNASSHATVNELEKVPALTAQLTNETKVAENTNTLLIAANGQVDTLNTRVAGLLVESDSKDAVCKAEIKVVKDAARKSNRRWFIGGFVTGFAARQAIKTVLGF